MLPVIALGSQGQSTFWELDGRYTLHPTATQRATLIPELQRAWGPPQDSIVGTMRVDRIVADSVFGRFVAPLSDIGLWPLVPKGHASTFLVVIRGNRIDLRLHWPTTDAQVLLSGTVKGRDARGTWQAQQRRTPRGTFLVVRE
jgi:hypothetical protein